MPKVNEADWKAIQAEYIRGGTSFRKLAEDHGVSFNSLVKIATREKWTDLRKKADEKRTSKLVNSVASQEAKRVDKFLYVADLLMQKIQEGVESGKFLTDSQSLRHIAATMKDLREIQGIKSESDLKEQMARIAKLEREAKESEQSQEIKVVIEKDLEEYAN